MKRLKIVFAFLCVITQARAQYIVQPDSAKAIYLNEQKVLGKNFSADFYPNYTRFHKLSELAFCNKIDSSAKRFYTLLKAYEQKLPSAYVSSQRFEIKMYFDKILVEYPGNHEIYSADRPPGYPIIEEKIKNNLPLFNDPALLKDSDLMPFIQSFLGYKISKELNKAAYLGRYNKRLSAMWSLLPFYFKNEQCRSFQQYLILYDHMNHNGVKYTLEFYQAFKKQCRDATLISKLEEIYRNSLNELKDHKVREYKRIGNYSLSIHIFGADKPFGKEKKPVIVFFHGGSWSEGQPSWHFHACRSYAEKGWIACAVEYRIYGSQGTLPFAAVRDARSAIRWLREHGDELNIDTGRIVASGNSAGGHLVLATALAEGIDEKGDNLKFSPIPNVLLVNSGVYDLTDEKTAWIRKDLSNKDLVKKISPLYLVRKNLPPILLIHSTVDQNVPYSSAQKFAELCLAGGNSVELKSLNEGGHFIFDHPKYTSAVFAWRKDFLKSLGYPESDGQ